MLDLESEQSGELAEDHHEREARLIAEQHRTREKLRHHAESHAAGGDEHHAHEDGDDAGESPVADRISGRKRCDGRRH